MDTVVLKFGGSSVADNIKLNVVAEKIKSFYEENKKVVVVVSAQGKTTDGLIKEAMSLSSVPNERELDVLLSTGEQISMAKVAILLNRLGMPAISLTGWQAGIYTNNTNQDAIIEDIYTSRIEKELEQGKIVIVAGFQGINPNMDITTLGRGGSDTTAVALAAKLKASKCYIFSDVDGVYTADPRQTKVARKINTLSYTEMLDIADEGAKVLHNRCVEIGDKFKIPIITKSTFNNKAGTIITDIIEENTIKSVVKKDISRISIVGNGISRNFEKLHEVLNIIQKNKLEILEFNVSESKISIDFKNVVDDEMLEKIHKIIKDREPNK